MTQHLKGLAITTLGVLLIVPDSLFVRLIDAEPLVTAFWRGLLAGVVILGLVMATQGRAGFRAAATSGWPGVIYVGLMATTSPGFVLAVTHTSVANVVFILAAMPVFAALLSRVFLGEPIRLRMVVTMAAVFVGLGIIAAGSSEGGESSWVGDLWALYVAAAFAGALTAARQARTVSLVPALPVAYIGAAILMIPFAAPFDDFAVAWPLFLGHGVLIGLSSCLLTLGPRYISSAEVALLILLESVLAPLLVWAIVGEDPGPWTLVGGAVVIGAVLASNLVLLRRRGPQPAS